MRVYDRIIDQSSTKSSEMINNDDDAALHRPPLHEAARTTSVRDRQAADAGYGCSRVFDTSNNVER